MNNFEGFRISEEEVTAEVEEIGRELEVELKMWLNAAISW